MACPAGVDHTQLRPAVSKSQAGRHCLSSRTPNGLHLHAFSCNLLHCSVLAIDRLAWMTYCTRGTMTSKLSRHAALQHHAQLQLARQQRAQGFQLAKGHGSGLQPLACLLACGTPAPATTVPPATAPVVARTVSISPCQLLGVSETPGGSCLPHRTVSGCKCSHTL